jgi:hypothetical protein
MAEVRACIVECLLLFHSEGIESYPHVAEEIADEFYQVPGFGPPPSYNSYPGANGPPGMSSAPGLGQYHE